MPRIVRDVAASVRARLLDLAKENGHAFDLVLTRFAIERLLYRLTATPHRDRFVLKGAMLMTTWFDNPHRPTRDVDLLGYGDPAPEALLAVFREVCSIDAKDGITFDANALSAHPIREEQEYGGVRLRAAAQLAGARIPVVIDIGFGDATEPGVEEIELPVMLALPSPRLRAYPKEAVVAEKLQAMTALGLANSRLKDYYDIWRLSRSHRFDVKRLSRAIAATFNRRETALPRELPDALSRAFYTDPAKQAQWTAFTRDLPEIAPSLDVVVVELAEFLMYHVREALEREVSRPEG